MSGRWWAAMCGGASGETAQDRLRTERALATARLFLGCATLAAAHLGAAGRPASLDAVALAAYAGWAAVIVLATRALPRVALRVVPVIHVIDGAWAAAVPFLLPDRPGAVLTYFVLVLAAAGLRWGAATTLASGVAVLSPATVAALVGLPPGHAVGTAGVTTRVPDLVIDLVTIGAALAIILSHERRLRLERGFVGQAVGDVARARGLTSGLRSVLANCTRHFGATAGLVVLRDTRRNRLHVFPGSHRRPAASVRAGVAERPVEETAVFMFEVPPRAGAWYLRRDSARRGVRGLALRNGWSTRLARFDAVRAGPLVEATGATSVLGADAERRGEWHARLLLLNAPPPTPVQLRLLQATALAVAPVLYRQYLHARLRSRVTATERTRLARELHDGLVQSMIGVEMQLEVLRRHAAGAATLFEPLVRGVRDLMRQCVAEARDVMQRLRPQPLTGRQVLRLIAEYADRLRDESGIDVRLLTSITDLDCPPRTCAQLARIVQEAFANARKHSGARTITVNLSRGPDAYRMIVEDDGRGLGFEGRRTLEQLEASESGPAVIKDRVRAIGGRLAIESAPGRGTRVIIDWPRGVHA